MIIDKITAIIPAAGIGMRFNYSKPKQYFSILGKTILEHTIELLAKNIQIDLIILNIREDDHYYNDINVDSKFVKVINNDNFQLNKRQSQQCPLITIRKGGNTRCSTIKNSIKFLQQKNLIIGSDWILVHDAVRCVLPANLLELFITKVIQEQIGGIMAIPVTDTLKKINNGQVIATIDRENIWQIQTPQMFKLHILVKAFDNTTCLKYTDESSLVENLNITPTIVTGNLKNIKLTKYEDIELISLLLSVVKNNA